LRRVLIPLAILLLCCGCTARYMHVLRVTSTSPDGRVIAEETWARKYWLKPAGMPAGMEQMPVRRLGNVPKQEGTPVAD